MLNAPGADPDPPLSAEGVTRAGDAAAGWAGGALSWPTQDAVLLLAGVRLTSFKPSFFNIGQSLVL